MPTRANHTTRPPNRRSRRNAASGGSGILPVVGGAVGGAALALTAANKLHYEPKTIALVTAVAGGAGAYFLRKQPTVQKIALGIGAVGAGLAVIDILQETEHKASAAPPLKPQPAAQHKDDDHKTEPKRQASSDSDLEQLVRRIVAEREGSMRGEFRNAIAQLGPAEHHADEYAIHPPPGHDPEEHRNAEGYAITPPPGHDPNEAYGYHAAA